VQAFASILSMARRDHARICAAGLAPADQPQGDRSLDAPLRQRNVAPTRGVVVWAPLGDLAVCESGDVDGVQLLVLNRGAPTQSAVASLAVVEDLQVLKIALASSMRVFHRRRSSSSVCIRAQKDSMTALS
jgi:hypothetical protein